MSNTSSRKRSVVMEQKHTASKKHATRSKLNAVNTYCYVCQKEFSIGGITQCSTCGVLRTCSLHCLRQHEHACSSLCSLYPQKSTRVSKLRLRLTLQAEEIKHIRREQAKVDPTHQCIALATRGFRDCKYTLLFKTETELSQMKLFNMHNLHTFRTQTNRSFFVIISDPLLRKYNFVQ